MCLTFLEQYQMFDTFLWPVTTIPFGINTLIWSQDCIESITTSLRTESFWGWNPGRGIDSCFSRSFRQALGPTELPVQWELGDSSGIKWLDLEADHLPSCSARLRKVGAILSITLHAFLACVVTTLHFFKPWVPFNYIFRGKSHGLRELCTSGNIPAKWYCWVVSFVCRRYNLQTQRWFCQSIWKITGCYS